MMYITQNSAKYFLIKRIIRVVPLYWVMTLIRFALSPSPIYSQPFNWKLLFESLFFIPGNIQPLYNIGWTLNHVMVFYIIFKLACLVNLKDRGKIAAAFIVTWVCSIQIFKLTYFYSPLPLEFILGIIAFEIIKRAHTRKSKNKQYGIIIRDVVCTILCVASLWFITSYPAMTIIYKSGDWELIRPAILGIPAMILVCAFCILTKDKKAPETLLFLGNIILLCCFLHAYAEASAKLLYMTISGVSCLLWNILVMKFQKLPWEKIYKFILMLGNISFSCYLWNILVKEFGKLLLLKINLVAADHNYYLMDAPNFIFMLASVLTTIAVGWVSYYFIEVKLSSWIRKAVLRKNA